MRRPETQSVKTPTLRPRGDRASPSLPVPLGRPPQWRSPTETSPLLRHARGRSDSAKIHGSEYSSNRGEARSSEEMTGERTSSSSSSSASWGRQQAAAASSVWANLAWSFHRQSWLSFLLSLAYHLVHILIVVSLLSSPLLMRSTAFSPTTQGRALLRAQGDLPSESGDTRDSGAPASTLDPAEIGVAVEAVWAIHDELFFFEPGRRVEQASIEDSFARLDGNKRNKHRGNGSKNNSDSGEAGNSGTDHAYVTKRSGSGGSEGQGGGKTQGKSVASESVARLASPPPLPDRHFEGRKKSTSERVTLSKIIRSWEASPLYSSPLALVLYYYLYCVASAVILLVGTRGMLTGHTSLLRLTAGLLEVIWYAHHGKHSFVIYSWLLRLSHRSPAQHEDTDFLNRATPYAAVRRSGSVQFYWFYMGAEKRGRAEDAVSPSLIVNKLDMQTYLYDNAPTYSLIAQTMSLMFLFVVGACLLKDLQRALDALLGLRSLEEPDGSTRCPLCGQLTEWCAGDLQDRPNPISASSPTSASEGGSVAQPLERRWGSVQRRLGVGWLLCGACRHRRGSLIATTSVATADSGAGGGVDLSFYEGAGSRRSSGYNHDDGSSSTDSTDTSEEDELEGGIVKVIVLPASPATAGAGNLDTIKSNTHRGRGADDSTADGNHKDDAGGGTSGTGRHRKGSGERQYMLHTTRHVHHRCQKLRLDAESADESSNDNDNESERSSTTSSPSSSSSEVIAANDSPSTSAATTPVAPAATSTAAAVGDASGKRPSRRVVIKESDNVVRFTEIPAGGSGVTDYGATKDLYGRLRRGRQSTTAALADGAALSGSASRFVQRSVYDALRDADDEFRPGNAFPCYEKAGTVARLTFSWLDPLVTFAMIEPTLLRHARFLPALPESFSSLECIGIPAWRLWVHRRHWYAGLVSTPGTSLFPTETALLEVGHGHAPAEEDSNSSENLTVVTAGKPRSVSMAKLRPQRPRRSSRERFFVSITRPLSYILRTLFCALYIDQSSSVKSAYQRLTRALLRDRLEDAIRSEGGDPASGENADAMGELASTSAGSSESDYSEAASSSISTFPSHLRHQLTQNDVSAFMLFMEHDCGRCFTYKAGPQLIASEVLLYCVVPLFSHLIDALLRRAAFLSDSDTTNDDAENTLWWCVWLTVVLVTQSITLYAYWRSSNEASLGAKTAVRTLVLEKTLALPLAQRTFDEDEVVRLATADAQLCGGALASLHHCWSYPVRFLVSAGMLWCYIGLAPALTLLGVAVVAVPTLRDKALHLRRHQRAMPRRSRHVSFMREALLHLRLVKSMLFEGLYATRVQDSLLKGKQAEQRVTLAMAWVKTASKCTYAAVLTLTFLTQYLAGGRMDATRLLTAMAIFAMLWEPLIQLPTLFVTVSRGYLALKRVEGFLRQSPDEFSGTWVDLTLLNLQEVQEEEQQRHHPRNAYGRGAVVCQGCSFTWQHDLTHQEPQPQLRNVFMHIMPGELVVVQGPMDAGKSTLLLAILGEVNRCVREDDLSSTTTTVSNAHSRAESELSVVSLADFDSRGRLRGPGSVSSHRSSLSGHYSPPSLHLAEDNAPPGPQAPVATGVNCEAAASGFSVFGTCVYCSQEPWLQSDTIRENIMAGRAGSTSARWYREVVRACALDRDFDELPRGDETVVGEKGEELSASQRARVALARAVYSRADIYLLDGVLSPLDMETRAHVVQEVFLRLLKKRTIITATNVGLATLRPHRIFTVVGTGAVREDTALYKEAARRVAGKGDGREEAESLADQTDEHGGDGGGGSGGGSEDREAHGGSSHLEDSPILPYLYGEEFEEAVVYDTDVDISLSEASSSDTSSTDSSDDDSNSNSSRYSGSASFASPARSRHGSSMDESGSASDYSDDSVSYSTDSDGDSGVLLSEPTQTDSDEDNDGSERSEYPYARVHHRRPTGIQVRPREVVAAFLTKQFVTVLLLVLVQQCLFLGVDIWVALWLSGNRLLPTALTNETALLVLLAVLGVCSTVVLLPLRTLAGFRWIGGVLYKACSQAVCCVLRLPVPLVDGRTATTILGILGKDFSVALRGVPESVNTLLGTLAQLLVIVIFNMFANPFFILALPTTVCLFCGVVHRAVVVSRELRRLETRSMATTITLLREALEGAPMVRCFGLHDRIREEYCHSLDTANSATVTAYMVSGWVGLRVRFVSALLTTMAMVLGVLFAGPRTSPSLTGIAVLLCMRTAYLLTTACQTSVRMRGEWVSLQRVMKLLKLPAEPLVLKGSAATCPLTPYVFPEGGRGHHSHHYSSCATPFTERPASGLLDRNLPSRSDSTFVVPALELCNVSALYRRGQSDGLENVSMVIPAGGRAGIVSRAGHGKSLVMGVVLRLAAAVEEGRVYVKGENVDRVPYPLLRSQFAMIPAEPLLLTETWRRHLLWGVATDFPSSHMPAHHDDGALWQALGVVGLGERVHGAGGLDSAVCRGAVTIAGGGTPPISRMSVPAMFQLLCLARALLWRPQFIIFEETSPGDTRVDATIQRLMQTEFIDTTLVIIAHRPNNIDALCSRIFALDDGEIVSALQRAPEAARAGGVFTETVGVEADAAEVPKTMQDIAMYLE